MKWLVPVAMSAVALWGAPTYTRDAGKILQTRCAGCHHAGEVAPFPLTTWEEARGKARMIAEVVKQRQRVECV